MPDAPVADGRFPVVEWSHGLGGNPESYGTHIRPLAAAGFIVPAPVFPTTTTGSEGNVGDVYNGNQSKDVSEVLTQTLALGASGSCDAFEDRMDTTFGVGAAGHSLGGMTTHGLLTAWPDSQKAPDAMLSIASAQETMGDRAAARKTLEELIAKYPGSSSATSAKQRLAAFSKR